MKIYEHQAKELLRKQGVSVPIGYPCFDVSEVYKAAKRLSCVDIKLETDWLSEWGSRPIYRRLNAKDAIKIASNIFNDESYANSIKITRLLVEEALKEGSIYSLQLSRTSINNNFFIIKIHDKKNNKNLILKENLRYKESLNYEIIIKFLNIYCDNDKKLIINQLHNIYFTFLHYKSSILDITSWKIDEDKLALACDITMYFHEEAVRTIPEIFVMSKPKK